MCPNLLRAPWRVKRLTAKCLAELRRARPADGSNEMVPRSKKAVRTWEGEPGCRYVSAHSAVRFSHGVCPECVKTVLQPELDALRRARAAERRRRREGAHRRRRPRPRPPGH